MAEVSVDGTVGDAAEVTTASVSGGVGRASSRADLVAQRSRLDGLEDVGEPADGRNDGAEMSLVFQISVKLGVTADESWHSSSGSLPAQDGNAFGRQAKQLTWVTINLHHRTHLTRQHGQYHLRPAVLNNYGALCSSQLQENEHHMTQLLESRYNTRYAYSFSSDRSPSIEGVCEGTACHVNSTTPHDRRPFTIIKQCGGIRCCWSSQPVTRFFSIR